MSEINSIAELEQKLSEPSEPLVRAFKTTEGDILILGAAGKMGPSLAKLAKRAVSEGKVNKEIIAVSRFSDKSQQTELEAEGIQTIAGDLLDESFLHALPEAKNIIYMAGTKFGTTGNEHFTWAMNAYLPGRVSEKFRNSRIIVFSTGNVYPFVSIDSGGATEATPTDPVGEYAQSCLGRERVFEHFSRKYEIPMLIYRLNYAIDLRYGVLFEIAKAVWERRPIDLRMGYVNVIWQGDANEIALRSLAHCDHPPSVLNVTGPETIEVKKVAKEFARLMDRKPSFEHAPSATALLSNASKAVNLFGRPSVSLEQMIKWTANWVQMGGPSLGKPTHFQERAGKF